MWERVFLARAGMSLFIFVSLIELYKTITETNELMAIFHLYVFVMTAMFAIGFELYIMHIKHVYHRTLKREKKWKKET